MSLVHSPSAHAQPGSAKTVADIPAWALEGDRYSPNLRRWMRENSRHHGNDVFADKDGKLWIGWIDDGPSFIGSRLWRVLTVGGRAEVGCWMFPVSDLTPVPDFWANYARIGRCAIDPDHSHYFIGDETRWTEQGDTRSCNWCGNHRQFRHRWTETVERQRWETRTAAEGPSVGTSNASEPKILPTNGDSQ